MLLVFFLLNSISFYKVKDTFQTTKTHRKFLLRAPTNKNGREIRRKHFPFESVEIVKLWPLTKIRVWSEIKIKVFFSKGLFSRPNESFKTEKVSRSNHDSPNLRKHNYLGKWDNLRNCMWAPEVSWMIERT